MRLNVLMRANPVRDDVEVLRDRGGADEHAAKLRLDHESVRGVYLEQGRKPKLRLAIRVQQQILGRDGVRDATCLGNNEGGAQEVRGVLVEGSTEAGNQVIALKLL